MDSKVDIPLLSRVSHQRRASLRQRTSFAAPDSCHRRLPERSEGYIVVPVTAAALNAASLRGDPDLPGTPVAGETYETDYICLVKADP